MPANLLHGDETGRRQLHQLWQLHPQLSGRCRSLHQGYSKQNSNEGLSLREGACSIGPAFQAT